MRLYTIKRKSDGKFYVSAMGYYAINTGNPQYQFASRPSQFLKTPDGVAGNLRKLCSEPYWEKRAPAGVSPSIAEKWNELAWRNFDASKLSLYEVVVLDVDVISMTATPAESFVQIEAIENAPLTKRERVLSEVSP